jgi:glycosyltransferase involved in cell wall biosynthesis
MSRRKILWLVSWYPNKLSPFNGDFIKRHAEAVSMFDEIQVIYVVRDLKGAVTENVHIEESAEKGLSEKIIYYKSPATGISIVDKFLSEQKFRKLYKQAINEYINENGLPALSHVHVGMKAGAVAAWLKKKKGVPYVVSEHWSGFLPEAEDKVSDQPFYIQSLWKKIMTGAKSISAVSAYLANAIEKKYELQKVTVIPNAVNSTIFFPKAFKENNLRFIHISGLESLKNVDVIIQAFAIVQKKYSTAQLNIVGPGNNNLKTFVQKLDAGNFIHFHNEVPQQQLVEYIRQSAALILYSSYETFGCVIIEANACGIPVIVSDIPSFHEIVTEGVNGIFAKKNDVNDLAAKMIELAENNSSFDTTTVAAESAKYSYGKTGKQFSDWYTSLLSKH